jgi:hypothetical protein
MSRFKLEEATVSDPEKVFPVPVEIFVKVSTGRFVASSSSDIRYDPVEASNAIRLV